MAFGPLVLGEQLAEGKTKILYAHPEKDDVVYMVHKDGITAGDGARRNTLPGKGALACRTTSNVFYLLEDEGIDTHYIGMVGDNANVMTRCDMIPLEVVMRRIATGSYLRRHPEVAEGARFDPLVVEFFYKDDARHDPLVTDDEIVDMGVASREEIDAMRETGRRVFQVLERAWAAQDVTLVDCKIEYGRAVGDGALLVADVIDNDSWRLWPGRPGSHAGQEIYRNMPQVTDERLAELYRKYAQVAEMTDEFIED